MNSSLADYESQLHSVNEALEHSSGTQRTDLLDLRSKLEEVILLLRDSLTDTRDATNNDHSDEKADIDDEFAKFQMEMSLLEGTSVENESKDDLGETSSGSDERTDFDELVKALTSLEGSKCRALFSQLWGEKEYHNALIVSTNFDPSTMESVEDIEIEVMFCHPICDQMKPCSFFLSGHCKFSDDRCRFSHGYKVKFSEIREFILPDYSAVSVDSKCLAQSSDGLWYRATVEKCLEDRQYTVKYDRTGKTYTVDAESLIPLEEPEGLCDIPNVQENDNWNDDYDANDDNFSSIISEQNPLTNFSNGFSSIVTWEQHNRGIGSKLMEKMGHVWGQGLGKNSDGRLDPVEAFILPAGKSLDKCIEMRENCHLKGPVSVESRLAVEHDKEERRAKRVNVNAQATKKETVFDFINSRIAKAKGEEKGIQKKHRINSPEENSRSPKDLNIQAFSVEEDIKKTRREISKLRQSLVRNSERNEVMKAQVEKKIAVQNDVLKNLQAKERKINQEIKSQTNRKKLSIF